MSQFLPTPTVDDDGDVALPFVCSNCSGELRMIVVSQYYQYRTVNPLTGHVSDEYEDCREAFGDTLETFLECAECYYRELYACVFREADSGSLNRQDEYVIFPDEEAQA